MTCQPGMPKQLEPLRRSEPVQRPESGMEDLDFDVSRHLQKIKVRRPPDIVIEQISDDVSRRKPNG